TVALGAPVASAHQDGCHSAHSCPSDHHTYVWDDAGGQGWSCARPGSDTYDPSRDTTLITSAGLPYYCYAVGSPVPPYVPPPEPAPAPAPPPPSPPTLPTPSPEPPVAPSEGSEVEPPPSVYVGHVLYASFARPSQTRPRELHPFSADDNAYLYGLRWSTWGEATAQASGKATANDCEPSCADGRFVRARGAGVTLFRRREGRCDGERALFYTRALLHWPRALHLRTFTVKLRTGCQSGG